MSCIVYADNIKKKTKNINSVLGDGRIMERERGRERGSGAV